MSRLNSDAGARGKRKSENKRAADDDRLVEDKAAHWRRVKEAGVGFWINDVTGVATDECPHASLRSQEGSRRTTNRSIAGKDSMTGFGTGHDDGTGALVYDSSEFEQAMRILDCRSGGSGGSAPVCTHI